ncbi:TIR domain-containing protein [Sphingomicrobium nitratireducens]|uniref:TIR domain-containing protein n=1 Tax=Sphingomicrobium nitratireducens TaxID=2964666 RepID=UPI00223EA89B|nr:TIR domain-containing protein [Sphingomicrobium nitratireducens]
MADIFVSYARADRERVEPIVRRLEDEGFSVWWDTHISAGEQFDELIDRQLQQASSVIVVWTERSVKSRWVRGEARDAADRGILVPIRFDEATLPIDFRALHTIDFNDTSHDGADGTFRALSQAVRHFVSPDQPATPEIPATNDRASICVLPFENISGDPEQAYFSDGITEDIITDLSHIASLDVTSRNSSFNYKGQSVNIPKVAKELAVRYVLEGSVRKVGDRVRITAQLIDANADTHLWAERYDRDLHDIFAVQDDISRSIVSALKVRLATEESDAIARRGTTSPEAYRYYLMARKYWMVGWTRHMPVIVRLCEKALELDAKYARAWALLAICLADIRFTANTSSERVLDAAQKALALDPDLADAHAAMARHLVARGEYEKAWESHQRALAIDPLSYEVNVGAARWAIYMHRVEEGIEYLKTAASADLDDFWAPGMMLQVYRELGDKQGEREAARECLSRVEKALEYGQDNSNALGFGIGALFVLGERERALDWTELVLILDPDNQNALYNTACSLAIAGETETALRILDPVLAMAGAEGLSWIREDSDLESLREDPRFLALLDRETRRLAT